MQIGHLCIESNSSSTACVPLIYRRMLLQENAAVYIKRHRKKRAEWQPMYGDPPPPPQVPYKSTASLFEEGEKAGEELHLLVLWHIEKLDEATGLLAL